jgi:FdrA protein
VRHLEIRSGLYRDSVQLMQISAAVTQSAERALVAMATGVNLELLGQMGFDQPAGAGPNDMVVAIVAADEAGLAKALSTLETELAGSGSASGSDGTGGRVAARTVGSAVRSVGDGALVLVSTPGRHAFVEAMDALDAGASVMVFSDNVSVEQEVALKRTAAGRGLLVMGPDCGTAVIGGVGLGFANVVRPGPVGIVAASGTGAQHVMSLLSEPVGISHCIGVGGRDLSSAVGGLSTHAGLDLLDADPATELIVVLGKPPAPAVADALRDHIERLSTPAVFAPLGPGQADLTSVAVDVLARRGVTTLTLPAWGASADPPGRAGALRGLFSGGTLCVEAMVVASELLGPVASNVPLRPEWTLGSSPHWMVDLGDDAYTVGRPHPMIDFGPRLALLEREATDPACRVLLLDVVLGHGAHPDPSSELAPAIRAALRREVPLTVVATLVGTPEDPQGLGRQAIALADAGAQVYASNAAAARHAVRVATGAPS